MPVDDEDLRSSLRALASRRELTQSGVVTALEEVTTACVDLFGVSGSGIMVADEQNITEYVAASDGPGRFLEQAESRTGQGVCTQAFVDNRVVESTDVCRDPRWPEFRAMMAGRGIHAVLGVPVRLGAIPVGTLDVYRDREHEWDDSERRALVRYSDVVSTTLAAALRAHTAGKLAGQLEYALDYRVIIERAVGFLMARDQVDAVVAFNRLRRAARNNRTKIGAVAEQLLTTGRLEGGPADR
ncbi:MAG TPA: GAF and ANTAR domain-containing protein [Microlunatus sp.]|nr:GAF and ANTAR domain-containing protein [Microlunatus sp.]